MHIAIDVTLRGTSHDPLPLALHAQIREAFEREDIMNFLALPDAKIQRLERTIGSGEWALSFHAEGQHYQTQLSIPELRAMRGEDV